METECDTLWLFYASDFQVWNVDRKGSATSSHGIRGYIYVMAILKFIVWNEGLKFC